MFKKVLKQFLRDFFRYAVYFVILPQLTYIILTFIFSRERLTMVSISNIFFPLKYWIPFAIFILFDSFMKVRTNNKNWPFKKK